MNSTKVFIRPSARYLLPWLAVIALLMTALTVVAQGPDGQDGEQPDPTAKRASHVQGGGQPAPSTKTQRDTMTEGFEAGVMPPSGWTHIQTNPNETWEIGTYIPHSGSYYAHVLYDSALLDQDEVLLSPTFTADSGNVSLWSFGNLYWCRDTYDNCDLEVWFVNGSWDGGGGDDVYLGLADSDWTGNWEWSHSTFDFGPYASGSPARIAFRYMGNDGAEISLDDITINHFGGACGDPHEPNDAPGQATPIGYGTTLADPDICPAGDEDYYSFVGSAGDQIAVDIDAWTIGSLLDPVLYLYDTDGVTELTYNDDYGALDSYLEYTLPTNGTYYLKVRDYGTPHGGPDYFYTIYLDTVDRAWTFLVYLDGDNNLEGVGIDDFLEMSSVGSTGGVNIVVQFDRISGYTSSYDDWTTTKRFFVTLGMTPTPGNAVADIGEANMGHPQTLIDFVQWGMTNYPADHYAVVLWDHGSGWRLRPDEAPLLKDVAYDDTSGGDALDMPELRTAMDTLSNGGLEPLDLVGFDACLMGMIEVDNQLIPYVDVRVGSEETEPGDGWPYDGILTSLTADPAMSASQLGTVIVDEYYASYGNNQTQSAVDLHTPYTSLNTAVNDFAVALINGASSHCDDIRTARDNTQAFYYPTYVDLYDFAYQVEQYVSDGTIDAAATAVMNAVSNAVIREQHGSSWPGARGISIYFPKLLSGYNSDYDGSTGWLEFTADTQWDEWLHAFYGCGGAGLDCGSAVTAYCGASYVGDTTGSPSNVDYYGCSGWYESGPEDVYVLTTSFTRDIMASLSDLSVDLDVFILSDCDENACEAYGDNVAVYNDAPAGTYYIVVDGYLGAEGSYTLDITCGGGTCNDLNEPNDTPGQATPITYDTTLSADICPAGDEDYYVFTANAGDTIIANIDAWAIGSALDSYLYLYDTDGVTELAYNDDYDGLDSRIVYPLPSDGTYYLKVRDFGGGGDPGHFYTISLEKGEVFDVDANWMWSAPTIDGEIASGEWTDAATYDITNPRTWRKQKQDDRDVLGLPEAFLGEEGPRQISVKPGDRLAPVTLYAMNDGTHLYLAIDNPNDTTMDTYDQMGVYFDDNPLPSDGQWTNTGCGHPDGEGNFWVWLGNVDYREWIAGPASCSVVSPAPGTSGSVGYDSGHTQIEIVIDLTSSALRAIPDDVINMYLFIYDANAGVFDGEWPITADFQDPSTYRPLTLATCPVAGEPNLSSPADDSSTCDTTPHFDWSLVSEATSYRIQVDNNSGFGSPAIDTTTSSPNYTPGSSLSPGTYYWRVRASNACGNGSWSSARSVTILSTPAAVSLSSPSNGASVGDNPPTFRWGSVSGVTSYRIQVADNSGFSSPEINRTTSSTSYTPGSALAGGATYYWRVRASNTCGSGSWSAVWEFATPAPSPSEFWIYLPILVKDYP